MAMVERWAVMAAAAVAVAGLTVVPVVATAVVTVLEAARTALAGRYAGRIPEDRLKRRWGRTG